MVTGTLRLDGAPVPSGQMRQGQDALPETAIDASPVVGQVNAPVAAGEVADLSRPFVVVVKLDFSTDAAHCFF